MHHNRLTRTLARLLVSLMALGTLAACSSGNQGEAQTTTAAPSVADTTAAPATEPAYVYPDVNYNGDEFAILNAKDRYNMLYQVMPAELNGEALNDARFKLNQQVAERYGITLKETQVAYGDLQDYAIQEVLANTPVHDIFYLSPKQVAVLMNSGYLHNLLDVNKLNIEEDWWDQILIESGTLKDKYLYYLGGNYHLQGFEGTTCIFFNKKMMGDLGLDNPYDLVRDGKWTMDKLYEYASKAANLNGDASFKYDANGSSVYGFASITNLMPALIMGQNAYYVERDDTGMPTISFTSEHFQDVCSKIANLTGSEGIYKSKDEVALFMANRALMIGAEIKAAANEMREMETEFGMLPIPKYDEAQENYISNMYWASHVVSIPVTAKDVERAAIVIDTLNYEAVDNLLPTYYDRVSYKGLRDQDSIDMLEIIRGSRYYNWGLAYGWLDSIEPTCHEMLLEGNGNIAALANSASKVVRKLIDKTMTALE